MPAAVLAVVGALGAGVFGAPAVGTVVSVQEETSAGYAPDGPDGERRPTMVVELVPAVGASLKTRRTTFEVFAGPRFYYRVPNLADLKRPLLLVRGGATHSYLLDPSLTWSTSAGVQYGEVEYSSAQVLFNSPTSRPTTDPVIDSLDVDGQTGFSWTATRGYQLSLAGVGGYSHPTGVEQEDTLFRTTIMGGANMNQRFRLDNRSSVITPATFRYYSLDAPDWTEVTQAVGYERSLARKTTFVCSVSATGYWELGQSAQVFPGGAVSIEHVIREERNARLVNRFSASTTTTYDPLLGRLYPVGGVEASLGSTFGTKWSAVATASAYTPLTKEPTTPDGKTDSAASLSASAGHRLTKYWTLDFGVRQTTRATHVTEPFELSAGESWVFGRLTFTVTSGR